jgi:hypothetical protein
MPVNFKQLIHEGDMSQNVYLQPDDFIYLPSALATDSWPGKAARATWSRELLFA